MKISIEQKERLNGLVDIRDISIDQNKSSDEKAKSYINQIGNPYCYKYGNMEISLDFVGTERLEEKVLNLFINK